VAPENADLPGRALGDYGPVMTTPDKLAIARGAYNAYVEKDRAAIERLIAPDFHFTSPLDNRLDRETYFGRCWPNSERIEAFEIIQEVVAGEHVFITYVGRNHDGHRFRNTERVTVRGQQIVEVEVYFGWSLPHPAKPGGFVDE
jgi:ketosteroid isomerase-like protein